MKGKFIVIDGLDGAGKATQIKLLVDYFKKQGKELELVDFPQYYQTFFGNLVGRYLKGDFGGLNEVSPYLASLTYAGDRWQAKEKMINALEKGKFLIAARYVSSNMAFMGAKMEKTSEREEFFNWLKELEYEIYGIPKEDFLIYLSVPARIGQKLVLQKGSRRYMGGKKKYDIHEENLDYLERVEKIYLGLLKRFPHWIKIDCVDKKGKLKSREEIHRLIIQVLKKKKIMV